MPTVVLIGGAIDAIFVTIYLNWAHPWIAILKKDKAIKKGKAEENPRRHHQYSKSQWL